MKVVIEPKGIVAFFDDVARAMGYTDVEHLNYDCTKISIAQNIQDLIFDFYRSEGLEDEGIAMRWVCFGPKALESLEDFEVQVEDGFITEVNNV